MKLIVFFILAFSLSWSIGLQGLIIPQNGQVLYTAGTGIAGNIDPSLNPAMTATTPTYLQFSLNHWLADIKGSHTAYHWGGKIPQHITLQSWNAKDIQLWGDVPDDRSLGTFSVHYISAAYSLSHNLNTPYRFGFRLQTNYSHLFTESMSGVTLDAGVLLPLNSFITAGIVVRNLGYEYTPNLRSELPIVSGIGVAIKLPLINTSVMTDVLYKKDNRAEIHIGCKTHSKWLNLHTGISIHEKRIAQALGFSFHFRQWLISYGVYQHENSILGLPIFLDVRRYM